MQRYFCDKKIENKFILSLDDSYHIKKVMRMNIGQNIEIVFDRETYICELTDLNDLVEAKIIDKVDENNELDKRVIICQSLVNEQKMDFILQKCTELGMYEFYPYKAMNSVVKDNGKSDKKIARWQRIVKEASEQSKRNIIPKVHDILDLKDLIKVDASLKLICTVNEMTNSVKKALQDNSKCDTIIIVVGPEGGFTKYEENVLMENGFVSVSLGKRVLRTETASLAILSMMNYEWMV